MGQNPLAFIARAFTNAIAPGQVGQQSDLWTGQRHGKYYTSVYGTPAIAAPFTVKAAKAGSVFRGSNQAGATLSAALATTYVGLCLSNPAGSGVNLAVKKASGIIIVAPAGELGLGLITGWSSAGVVTHTTSLNTDIINGYIGAAATGSPPVAGPAPLANLDAACTIVGTPVWDRWLSSAIASTDNPNFNIDLDEDMIIPPGGYVAMGANVAGPTAGFVGTFEWEELAP